MNLEDADSDGGEPELLDDQPRSPALVPEPENQEEEPRFSFLDEVEELDSPEHVRKQPDIMPGMEDEVEIQGKRLEKVKMSSSSSEEEEKKEDLPRLFMDHGVEKA